MNRYKKIIEYLDKSIKNDLLSHAYIFYGPDETKKTEIARWFANKILSNENQKWHPDFLSGKPEANNNLTIGLVRQIKKFLILSPHTAAHKVVIIESAEKLNNYAQDALLKIFEEAPEYAIIILCANNLDSLSETIVSRGIKLPFWRQAEIVFSGAEQRTLEILSKFYTSDLNEKYSIIEKLSKNNPVEVLSLWLKLLRNRFLTEPSIKTAKILEVGQEIFFKLNETNYNPKLAYDELILNLEYGIAGKI